MQILVEGAMAVAPAAAEGANGVDEGCVARDEDHAP